MTNLEILTLVRSRGSFSFGDLASDRRAAREFRDWALTHGAVIVLHWGANAGGCVAALERDAAP